MNRFLKLIEVPKRITDVTVAYLRSSFYMSMCSITRLVRGAGIQNKEMIAIRSFMCI